jgi:hypothetical protein
MVKEGYGFAQVKSTFLVFFGVVFFCGLGLCACLFCRHRDSKVTPSRPLEERAEEVAGKATVVGEMTVKHVSYPVVAGKPSLKSAFEKACTNVIAANAGIPVADVQVTLSSGSVKVSYEVQVPSSSSKAVRKSLASDKVSKDLVAALAEVSGIEAAVVGKMLVVDAAAPQVVAQVYYLNTKPIMEGLYVVVTKDAEKYERECRISALSWPCLADGTSRDLKRGHKGMIEEVDFSDRTVRLSNGLNWVPIRALLGFETWSRDQEHLQVQGTTGGFADVINGGYTLSDEAHNGRNIWQKDGSDDKWLVRFSNGLWYLTSTERWLADQVGGWMESTTKDESDPGRAGPWRVWTGSTWETQGSVDIIRFRAPPPKPTPTAPLTPPPTPPALPPPWWDDPDLGGYSSAGLQARNDQLPWRGMAMLPAIDGMPGTPRSYAEEVRLFPALSSVVPAPGPSG